MDARFYLQSELVLMGFHVLLSDVDTSYLRDPHNYFLYSADVEGQADIKSFQELTNTTEIPLMNGGFYLAKTTYGGLRMLNAMREHWISTRKTVKKFDDQNALNQAIATSGCIVFPPQICNPNSSFTAR